MDLNIHSIAVMLSKLSLERRTNVPSTIMHAVSAEDRGLKEHAYLSTACITHRKMEMTATSNIFLFLFLSLFFSS
jgi:hypothetical protein